MILLLAAPPAADASLSSGSTIAAIIAAASPIILGVLALLSPKVQQVVTRERPDTPSEPTSPDDTDGPTPAVLPPTGSPIRATVQQLNDNTALLHSMIRYQQDQLTEAQRREDALDGRIIELQNKNTQLQVRVAQLESEIAGLRFGRSGQTP